MRRRQVCLMYIVHRTYVRTKSSPLCFFDPWRDETIVLKGVINFSHVAGVGVISLRIAPEKMLVFSESLPYTSLEIGLKTIFHLWP